MTMHLHIYLSIQIDVDVVRAMHMDRNTPTLTIIIYFSCCSPPSPFPPSLISYFIAISPPWTYDPSNRTKTIALSFILPSGLSNRMMEQSVSEVQRALLLFFFLLRCDFCPRDEKEKQYAVVPTNEAIMVRRYNGLMTMLRFISSASRFSDMD